MYRPIETYDSGDDRAGPRRIGDRDAGVRDGAVLRRLDSRNTLDLAAPATRVRLVVALDGVIGVRGPKGGHVVPTGQALLLASTGRTVCSALGDFPAAARGLIVPLSRTAIQAAAAAHSGIPCRLTAANLLVAGDAAFAAAVNDLVEAIAQRRAVPVATLEDAVIASMVRCIATAGLATQAFSVVRSVQCAMAHVRAAPHRDCSDFALARVAGITPVTLRRNFRECLGIPVARFVREARLDGARDRLGGSRETRSIEQIALDSGFPSASVFSRAYSHRFGESPSRTRRRAAQD